MAGVSDCSRLADGDSSLNQPKSNADIREIISIPGPAKDGIISNLCTSVEGPTKNSTISIPNICPTELVRKRKLVEDSSYFRQAPRSTLREGNVCPKCLQLDLQKAVEFYTDTTGRFRSFLAIGDVGHRYRQPLDTDCQLCLMLSASRITNEISATSSHSDVAEESDTLWAYSFLDHSNLHNAKAPQAELKMRKAHDSLCLAVVPRNCQDIGKLLTAHGQREGYAVTFLDENQANMFAAQVVPSRFDPGPIRIWFDYCKRNHKTLCPSSNCQLHGLNLIDCENLAIQDATNDNPYVALSYVWGSASDSRVQVQYSSGTRLLPPNLPPVISDAISVTKTLGFRYLWIDKYCIDQNNAATKHDQIQQMDAIYENAQLTIIAAAGADENYGLPGVGTRSRIFQPTARVGEIKVVWTMRDPHNSIRSSKWFTRGWTFQEAILSRRRLVFTEEQVYFECNAMNCFESICTPLEKLHIKNRSKIRDSIRAGVFGRNERQVYGKLNVGKLPLHQSFAQYLTAVEEYSARELTYDQDSLNAFKGIIRQFSRRKIPIFSIWGISYPGSHLNSKERESYFVDSITWSHARSSWEECGKPRRRPEFPSWSWAGWAGGVEYRERDYSGKSWFLSQLRSVALEDRSGTLTMVDSLFRLIPEHENHLPRVLHVKAMVVPQDIVSYDEDKNPENPWVISNCQARLFLSWGPDSETRFYQELKEGHRWQCMLVGFSVGTGFVMVLETHLDTDITSRAGLFTVEPPSGRASSRALGGDNPEWRTYRVV